MSGIEIAGLILGVVGIAGPLHSLTKAVCESAKPSDSFHYFLEDVSSQVLQYQRRYTHSCRSLLKPMGIAEVELDEMFGRSGAQHRNWQDPDFLQRLQEYLGNDEEEVSDVVAAVKRENLRLRGKIHKFHKKIALGQAQAQSQGCSSADSSLSAKEKFWISKHKGKTRECLGVLGQRIKQFKELVDRVLAKKSSGLAEQRRQALQEFERSFQRGVHDDEWKMILKGISFSRLCSKYVFQALAKFHTCCCHDLKLSLDIDLVENLISLKANPALSSLYFIATLTRRGRIRDETMELDNTSGDSISQAHRLKLLEIRSRCIKSPRTRSQAAQLLETNKAQGSGNPSQSVSNFASPTDPRPLEASFINPISPSWESSEMPSNKKKAFNSIFSLPQQLRFKRPKMPDPPSAPTLPTPPQSTNTSDSLIEYSSSDGEGPDRPVPAIDDLCAILSKIGTSQTSKQSKCMGYLDGRNGFQQHIFGKGSLIQMIEERENWSLRELISQSKDFLTEDRLRVAYHMASTLLHLHLPTWASGGWRSSDVTLIRDPSYIITRTPEWLLFSQCFHDLHNRRISEEDGSRSNAETINPPAISHICKLGILLVEIGQDRSLPEGLGPEGQIEAANQLLRDTKVERLLGRKYWGVAEVCLDWRERTGKTEDLLKEDVQRCFYDEVVQKLKHWVDLFCY